MRLIERYRALNRAGLLGLNARNGNYISKYNPRRLYPRVDDKILCKEYLAAAGLPVPALYGVISTQHEASHLTALLDGLEHFAVKPANGSGGDGIQVILGRKGDRFQRTDGRWITLTDLEHHVSGILSGMFSLGGHPDRAMVEALVHFDPAFRQIAWQGVPDVRVIVFQGFPVMAMTRLPTRSSGGCANLHKGAVGVGIDIDSGETVRGTWGNDVIEDHPDTGVAVHGFQVPRWDDILEMAAGCYETIGLGYLGVDIVLDENRGPMILELNARPGLSIQVANQCGLRPRLERIEGMSVVDLPAAERVATARQLFGGLR
jgi:alpha-L-glutamate ligase-like protein